MAITIRDVDSFAEVLAVEQLQREVWGFNDLDIVPSSHLIATQKNNGLLIGAFDGAQLVGFAYSFIGLERAQMVMHSHMLAVKREYQNQNIGFRLKLAQRERTLQLGINLVTWTYDPLQALNAHFNFAKLGVYCDRYEVNFYGEETSSFLHQGLGTDRLWVSWPIASQRVAARIQEDAGGDRGQRSELNDVRRLPIINPSSVDSDFPGSGDRNVILRHEPLLLEIPANINDLKTRNLEAARQWRDLTRQGFIQALKENYIAEDFVSFELEGRKRCFYLLSQTNRPAWL